MEIPPQSHLFLIAIQNHILHFLILRIFAPIDIRRRCNGEYIWFIEEFSLSEEMGILQVGAQPPYPTRPPQPLFFQGSIRHSSWGQRKTGGFCQATDGFGWDNETCTSDRDKTQVKEIVMGRGRLNSGNCRRTTWNHIRRIECGHMELKNHRFVLPFGGL